MGGGGGQVLFLDSVHIFTWKTMYAAKKVCVLGIHAFMCLALRNMIYVQKLTHVCHWQHTCTHAPMSVHAHMHEHMHTHTAYTHTHTHTEHIHTHAAHMHRCMHAHTHTHTHTTHTHTPTYSFNFCLCLFLFIDFF